jgi:putative hydrolase of the HAD superfamily
MPINALMVDVDGVLVTGRPMDGRHWQSFLHADLGITPDALNARFFAPHWSDIVIGRTDVMTHLPDVLQSIAPRVSPETFLDYWFTNDSRVNPRLLAELSLARASGTRVYLATNQEHLRATYLMETLGLAEYVDGMYYSADVGARKPAAAFFTAVQAAVHLDADALVLIDDTLENVDAARSAGWQALHWTEAMAPESIRALYR